jgi:hypothetical protein
MAVSVTRSLPDPSDQGRDGVAGALAGVTDDAEEDAGTIAVTPAGGDRDDTEAVAVAADRTIRHVKRHDEWTLSGREIGKRWSRPGRRILGG